MNAQPAWRWAPGQIGDWLAAGPLPYDAYGLDRDALVAYAVRATEHACRVSDVMLSRAIRGPAEALAVYQPLAWDTEVLGVEAGRVNFTALNPAARGLPDRGYRLLGEALIGALATADGMRAQHVSARVDARDTMTVQALEAQGFQVVDGLLKFGIDLEAYTLPAPDGPVRDATETDIPALRALAADGFVYDRFHNDPVVAKETADTLHAVWVENAVRGKTGCGVLVAEVDGEPAGFFILAEDALAREVLGHGVGTLVLITVGKRFRRRGLARRLSLAGAARLRDRGNRFVEVGTQLANLPASRVYLDAGFSLVQTSLSLRRWVPED